MLPATRDGRRLLGGAAVLLASVIAVASGSRMVKADVPTAPDYRHKGAAAAPVLIVEFSDFECPACRYAENPLKDLLKLYDGKARFIFKNFPLRQHAWARQAATAAECAGRQGKFWPYHDRLYENQAEWAESKNPPEFLTKYALADDLDLSAFAACQNDPSIKTLLDSEVAEGENRWVSSTPTFFINGKRFVGARQLTSLGVIWIDKQLKANK